MSHGGYWDKRGNQFEDRWALHQLVLLTSPSSNIASLEREPVGDDEQGVDLWVNRKDGTRECDQCKLSNKGKPSWSMVDLRRDHILEHLQFQVSRDPQRHRYHLVSGTPAPLLERLCNEARDSLGAATFWGDQILPVAALRKAFSEFCDALNLSPNSSTDQEVAWSLLRRSRFVLFRGDEEQLGEMADLFQSRVDRDPMAALRALEGWVRDQLRRPIDIEEVAAFLARIGFRLIRGQTDRFDLEAKKLKQQRREQGGLLRFEAELATLQQDLGRQAVDRVHVLAGRWRLTRKIDAGGFAEIWQGEDLQILELDRQPVAVKILFAAKGNDPILVQRFRQGGHIAASVADRRIPRILAAPAEADGRHFYVMEYVEGRNLSDWVSRQLLPVQGSQEAVVHRDEPAYGNAAWVILSSVGDVLSLLHTKGFVHGDVKPKNILVGRQGAVKLCDFDLVHGGSLGRGELVTIGTLPYIAPEILGGQEASPSSDQYSLAMTVVSVIQGSEPLQVPRAQLLQGLPCSTALKKNLERALASEAQTRFATVEEFMSNLGAAAFEAWRP